MPWTMGAFAIATLSMIGLPPTAGFLSKWYLLGGAWQAESIYALVVLTLSTLLNAAYFLPIVYQAFLAVGTKSIRMAQRRRWWSRFLRERDSCDFLSA